MARKTLEEPAVEGTEPNPVKVKAVFNRMRNPHTGAIFTKHKSTDVIDLNSDDNNWTRAQIRAKVLEVV